jgi:hypothetical protein
MKIRYLIATACVAPFFASTAEASPQLYADKWIEITPPQVTTGSNDTCIAQGLAIDPQHPSTIYFGNAPFDASKGGLFKTEDGGSNWTRVGKITPVYDGATDHLDEPLHVRVDPNNPKRLYVGDAVRGTSFGFWVSQDAGETFVQPQGFKDIIKQAAIQIPDIYDVAVDPSNFDHALLSFHYPWGDGNTKYHNSAGILETRDGGNTWIVHDPVAGVNGAGQSIKFLFSPDLTIGNSDTWLFGAQEGGYWRTADAGKTWTQVHKTNITHGGSDLYYSKSGWLYTSGAETILRSDVKNNGLTWETVGPSTTSAVGGDGDRLWTGKAFGGNSPLMISADGDGSNWANFNDQVFVDGPFALVYDQFYGIMYASNWSSGVWALKANAGSGQIPPLTTPRPLDPVPAPTPSGGSGGTASGSGGANTSGTGGASMSGVSGSTPGASGAPIGVSGASPSASGSSAFVGDVPNNAPNSGGCAACRMGSRDSSHWAMLAGLAALGLVRARRARSNGARA